MIADIPINDFPDIQSGRFQIVELLGSGGAGKVYKAIDTTLKKTVAIKTLHSVNAADAVRFQREAKLLGVLRHSNVMQVYDFGITQNQEPYLVLEYVEGKTLAQRLKDEQSIPSTVALKIFTQIAAGLSHAHSNHVIHRDIKPGNIILVEGDNPLEVRALIVDFGLAKQKDEAQELTAPGIGLGTPRYMSPEQIRTTEIDHRTDIYSFGCLMFQTLTGVAPFDAESVMEVLEQHLSAEPPTLRDTTSSRFAADRSSAKRTAIEREYSESLENIVGKCLQKSADQRYQSAEQLRLDLLEEFQKELVRNREELPVDLAPAALRILPAADNTGITTKQLLSVSWKVAALCMLILGLWTLGHAGFDHVTPDVKVNSRAEDDKLLHGATELPVSAVYRSKTGVILIIAENDAQLKNHLKGLHAKRIDLSGSTFTPQGFREAETSEVEQINYVGDKIGRAHLEAFSEPKHLVNLQIGGMGDKFNSDDLVAAISGANSLRQLTISNQTLTMHDFNNIVKLNRLMQLDLSDCRGITADKLVLLKKLPYLNSLTLDNTGVTDKEIHVVASLDLKYVGLKLCKNLTAKGFDDLGRMKHLEKLNIRGTSYPIDVIEAFRRHNSKVMPDRGHIREKRIFDYTKYDVGEMELGLRK